MPGLWARTESAEKNAAVARASHRTRSALEAALLTIALEDRVFITLKAVALFSDDGRHSAESDQFEKVREELD